MRYRFRAQAVLNTHGNFFGCVFRAIKEDHHKLFTAVARHDIVRGSHRLPEHLRHAGQTFVTGLMTIGVVVKFEIIYIQHNQREGFFCSTAFSSTTSILRRLAVWVNGS